MAVAEPTAPATEPPVLASTRRRSIAVGAFTAWTLFVWVGRIRNALEDDTLSSSERTGTLTLAGIFVVVAVVVAVLGFLAARSPRSRALARASFISLSVATAWTIGVWVSRMVSIAGGDWSVGFVVVHLVLAVVSSALVVWALVSSLIPRPTESG